MKSLLKIYSLGLIFLSQMFIVEAIAQNANPSQKGFNLETDRLILTTPYEMIEDTTYTGDATMGGAQYIDLEGRQTLITGFAPAKDFSDFYKTFLEAEKNANFPSVAEAICQRLGIKHTGKITTAKGLMDKVLVFLCNSAKTKLVTLFVGEGLAFSLNDMKCHKIDVNTRLVYATTTPNLFTVGFVFDYKDLSTFDVLIFNEEGMNNTKALLTVKKKKQQNQ